MAEQIRQILVQEQDHQIDLATALGEKAPACRVLAPMGNKSPAQRVGGHHAGLMVAADPVR